MPKEVNKQNRVQSRRAASKEALKQMHILLGDEKRYEISSDDDDVIEVDVQPPKKKYKLSHRKSSDGNDRDVIVLKSVVTDEDPFELEVVVEDLTPTQQDRLDKLKKENDEIEAKIEQLQTAPNTEVIYKGVLTTALEISEQVQTILTGTTQITLPNQTASISQTGGIPQPGQSIVLQPQPGTGTNAIPQSYQLVMDPRLGVFVGAVSTPGSTTNTPILYQPKVTKSSGNTPEQPMKTRRGTILRQVPSSQIPPLQKPTFVQKTSTPATKPTTSGKGLQVRPMLTKTPAQKTVTQKTMTPKPAPAAAAPKTITAPQKPIMPIKARQTPANTNMSTFRPTETNVEGGLTMGTKTPAKSIDLTGDDGRALPDSREVSFNKLQGRTYPSLVVVARPHLRVKDLAADRGKLDVKVKSVLMYPPTKFTEWLIQQGLVRSDQKCSIHPNNALKLGMYSDATKFPYSGGYVWISECCPQKFVSVFSGSVFEGSQHPPMAILKLLYHWCCQTIVQNVTQWVKVDNLYVKQMYTWLRAICTVALHTHVKQLGGPGVKVQVGVISLGTTSQDGNKREVKVEVLGILETTTRHIRLRAVEPLIDGERNYKKRFTKILEPVYNWVHPASIIVTDLTVDKATLHQMGFQQVAQSTSTDYSQSNRTIMEYLRRIVPRMFQNTLSLLSRQIIQQFLDELVWREWYGTTVLQSFDNMVQHISEQTRHDAGPLIHRLNKVVANPFKNWSIPIPSAAPAKPNTTTVVEQQTPKRYSRQRKLATTPQPPVTVIPELPRPSKSTPEVTPRPNKSIADVTPRPNKSTPDVTPRPNKSTPDVTPRLNKSTPEVPRSIKSSLEVPRPNKPASEVSRPTKSTSPDVPEQMVPLENYYYGTINPFQSVKNKVTISIKCPFCKMSFSTNISLMNHLFKHAHNVSNDVQLCRYCLTIVPTGHDLLKHIDTSHPAETKFDNGFVCLICESHFRNPFILGKHMSKEHCPSELPYSCGTCGFRCSNHKQAVDHFYQTHDHGTTIQCPFCLKSTTIFSGGRNISQNMNYFIQHLQKHQKKQLAKRCGRCTLWFIQKEFLKDHHTKMHASQRGKTGLVPSFAPRNGVMVPKSKMDKCPDDAKVINFSTLHFTVGKNLNCKECNKPMNTPKHFSSFERCQNPNCQFSTCCSNSMQDHISKCKFLSTTLPNEKLPYEMFCICGFKDTSGNGMAKHLAICERKSAYPSTEAAKAATVTHSMLDVLGLVRKPDEAASSKEPPLILKRSEPLILKRGRPRKNSDQISVKKVIEVNCELSISDVKGGVDLDFEDEVKKEETPKTAGEQVQSIDLTDNDDDKPLDGESVQQECPETEVVEKKYDSSDQAQTSLVESTEKTSEDRSDTEKIVESETQNVEKMQEDKVVEKSNEVVDNDQEINEGHDEVSDGKENEKTISDEVLGKEQKTDSDNEQQINSPKEQQMNETIADKSPPPQVLEKEPSEEPEDADVPLKENVEKQPSKDTEEQENEDTERPPSDDTMEQSTNPLTDKQPLREVEQKSNDEVLEERLKEDVEEKSPEDVEQQTPKDAEVPSLEDAEVQSPEETEVQPPKDVEVQPLEDTEVQPQEVAEVQTPEEQCAEEAKEPSPDNSDEQSPEDIKKQSPEDIREQSPEDIREQSPEDIREQSPEDIEEQPSEEAEDKSPEDAEEQPSEEAEDKSPERTEEQPSEEIEDQPSEDAEDQPSEDTEDQLSENAEEQRSDDTMEQSISHAAEEQSLSETADDQSVGELAEEQPLSDDTEDHSRSEVTEEQVSSDIAEELTTNEVAEEQLLSEVTDEQSFSEIVDEKEVDDIFNEVLQTNDMVAAESEFDASELTVEKQVENLFTDRTAETVTTLNITENDVTDAMEVDPCPNIELAIENNVDDTENIEGAFCPMDTD